MTVTGLPVESESDPEPPAPVFLSCKKKEFGFLNLLLCTEDHKRPTHYREMKALKSIASTPDSNPGSGEA